MLVSGSVIGIKSIAGNSEELGLQHGHFYARNFSTPEIGLGFRVYWESFWGFGFRG